jgi:hypothetical protein
MAMAEENCSTGGMKKNRLRGVWRGFLVMSFGTVFFLAYITYPRLPIPWPMFVHVAMYLLFYISLGCFIVGVWEVIKGVIDAFKR